jgi:hypothetical protein
VLNPEVKNTAYERQNRAAQFDLIILGSCPDHDSISSLRTAGVNVGNKFRYNVTSTWSSDDPNATSPSYIADFNKTQWIEVTVVAISGTNMTGKFTQHFFNGTEPTADGWADVDIGNGTLSRFFISANLSAGDTMYNSSEYSTRFINETVPRTYLGGVRDTNHVNTTSHDGTNTSYSFYWDKLTGVLVDQFVENIYQTGNYTYSWAMEMQIISSDLWVVPEFSAWTPALLMLIALASATVIIARHRTRFRTL